MNRLRPVGTRIRRLLRWQPLDAVWRWVASHVPHLTITIAVFVVARYLYWLANPSDFDERIKTLTVIGTGIGAVSLFINLYFTYQTVENSHKTLEHQRETRFTDRFYDAVEQLGHANEGVRLGSLYALKSLFFISSVDRLAILEVITAFIRDRGNRPRNEADDVPRDVFQAVVIIGTLNRVDPQLHRNLMNSKLYVKEVDLHDLTVSDCSFAGIDFSDTDLGWSTFIVCDFSKADLRATNLRDSLLTVCDFANTNFNATYLQGTSFFGSRNLTWTQLEEARLDGHTLLPDYLRESKPDWYIGRFESDVQQ